MANKPIKTPQWNTGLANNVEPSGAKKILGWVVGENPVSSSFFNWIQNLTGLWFDWLDARTNDSGAAPRIGLRGIESTAEDANGNGANLTGLGSGAGASATGGATGHGVKGTTPAGGTGAGVASDASQGSGYGVIAKAALANPNSSALRIVPQTQQPSIHLKGDLYVRDADGAIFIYDGTAWRQISTSATVTPDPFISVGDGVNSIGDYNGTDQAPFIAALAALPSGGMLFVKPGTYTFTAKLTIATANIRVLGNQNGVAHIQGAIAGDALIEITADSVEISNVEVVQTSNTVDTAAISVKSTNAKIRDCVLENTADPAAGGSNLTYVIRLTQLALSGCVIDNNRIICNSITNSNNYGIAIVESLILSATVDMKQHRFTRNSFSVVGGVHSTPDYVHIEVIANHAGAVISFDNSVIGDNVEEPSPTTSAIFLHLIATKTAGTSATISKNLIKGNVIGFTAADFVSSSATGAGASIKSNVFAANLCPATFGDRIQGIVKAYARISTDGIGGITLSEGFNVASVAFVDGTNIKVTFSEAMPSSNYAVNSNDSAGNLNAIGYYNTNVGDVSIREQYFDSTAGSIATAVKARDFTTSTTDIVVMVVSAI
jgi:hypothetical protein